MQVKIDTKEKFHAISVPEKRFAANMTAELDQILSPLLQNDVKNIILILKDTGNIDIAAAKELVLLQQKFYENNASFVICSLQQQVEDALDKEGLLEFMNVTPTLSEASDVVYMEEIERELLDE